MRQFVPNRTIQPKPLPPDLNSFRRFLMALARLFWLPKMWVRSEEPERTPSGNGLDQNENMQDSDPPKTQHIELLRRWLLFSFARTGSADEIFAETLY
ncbi:MAG TPA: hypothetical protein VMB85_21115 [Bryobacteraceae bacterium]|nr:hypothetical protein [Bryobacteraceae bacterium]